MVTFLANFYECGPFVTNALGLSILGGGGGGSIVKTRHLPIFNLVTKFFKQLCTNYWSVRIMKLHTLHEFQHQPHESLWKAYMQMEWLINMTKKVIEAQAIQFLVWDLGKWSQATGLKHNFDSTYIANFGLSFSSFRMHQSQYDGGKDGNPGAW